MKKPKLLALLVTLWMKMIRTPTPACVLSQDSSYRWTGDYTNLADYNTVLDVEASLRGDFVYTQDIIMPRSADDGCQRLPHLRGSAKMALPGLLCMGVDADSMVIAPFAIPAPPNPATARPMMSILEDRAAPHSAEPISNTPTKMAYVSLLVLAELELPESVWVVLLLGRESRTCQSRVGGRS